MSNNNPQIDILLDEVAHIQSSAHSAFNIFENLCSPYEGPGLLHLKEQLQETAEWLTQLLGKSREYDIDLASILCARAVMLLDGYEQLNENQKSLVVGAVRYFLFRNDAHPDKNLRDGLEDDRLIFNYVLVQLRLLNDLIPNKAQRTSLAQHSSAVVSEVKKVSTASKNRREKWKAFRKTMKVS